MKKIIMVMFLFVFSYANAQEEFYWVANCTPSMNADIGDCWPRVISDVVVVNCTREEIGITKDQLKSQFEAYFVANYAKSEDCKGVNGVSPTSLIWIETGLFLTRTEAEAYKTKTYDLAKNDEFNCKRAFIVKGLKYVKNKKQ